MDEMFPKMLAERSDEHPKNRSDPMDVTELGMVAPVSEVLFLNTPEPMAVTV